MPKIVPSPAAQPESAGAADPWLTVQAAAELANLSTKTIYGAVRTGRLRAATVGGRRTLRIRTSWVQAWLEADATPVEIQGPTRNIRNRTIREKTQKAESRANSERVGVGSSKQVSSSLPKRDDADPERLDKLEPLVEEFRAWHNSAYLDYHRDVNGQPVPKVLHPGHWEMKPVRQLLSDGWTLDQLKQATKEFWSIQDDPADRLAHYIATRPNRSLVILGHTINELHERKLRGEEPHRRRVPSRVEIPQELYDRMQADRRLRRGGDLPAHVESVLGSLRVMLHQDVPSALSGVLAGITDKLAELDIGDRRSAASQLKELDAELLEAAAAADADLYGVMTSEAERELADYRLRGMPDDEYQRSRRVLIERQLRERFRLPALIWPGTCESEECERTG